MYTCLVSVRIACNHRPFWVRRRVRSFRAALRTDFAVFSLRKMAMLEPTAEAIASIKSSFRCHTVVTGSCADREAWFEKFGCDGEGFSADRLHADVGAEVMTIRCRKDSS